MRDSRILLLIVIMVLGDLSRAGPHKKQDENPPCVKECVRRIDKDSDMFSELLPGPKYCKGMKDLVACWDEYCTTKDEKAAVNKNVEIYRDFFDNHYQNYKCGPHKKQDENPPCVKECVRRIDKDSDMFSELLPGPKYCKGMKDLVACWDEYCTTKDEKAAVNKNVEIYRDFFDNHYQNYKCGPHKKQDENPPCVKECVRRIDKDSDMFSELLPGPKYCKGMKDLVACWDEYCTTKDEKAAVNKNVEIYRDFFDNHYQNYKCGPHKKQDENPPCVKECVRRIDKDSDMFSELLPGPKYCKGMKDLVACWDEYCTTKDEKAAVNKNVEIYRDFFDNHYQNYKCGPHKKQDENPPCVKECVRRIDKDSDMFSELLPGPKYCKGMKDLVACWDEYCTTKDEKAAVNKNVEIYRDFFDNHYQNYKCEL